jgi:hypothetical protein
LTSAGRAKVNTTGLLTYGFINTIVNIPVMLSFSKIIFSDKFFQPYNDQLAKLVMVSAAVHSAGFCLFSELPFAVGQVRLNSLPILQILRRKKSAN